MAIADFQSARSSTKKFLRDKGITKHNFYGPFSDQYWDEPFRIVAVNMESYGYPDLYEYERDDLIDWLNDVGKVRTRTARYTLSIQKVLLDIMNFGKLPTRESFTAAYGDIKTLERTLDRTVYFNIRPESNGIRAQNVAAIAATGKSDIGAFLWRELLALDPHIILISGIAGLAALNGCAKIDPPLRFREKTPISNRLLIQSIAHPSRPDYTTWCSIIEGIAQWFNQGKETKSNEPLF